MNILIVGAGQLGYFLAKNLLEEKNHKVSLIDIDKVRCEKIANDLNIPVFCGDATRIETLAAAKAGKNDVLVAVTNKDEDNLIVCEIAKKQFNVEKVVSKSNNPKNISIMKKLGIDIAVNTTEIITGLIEHEIDGAQVRFAANISNSDAVISEYAIPFEWSQSGKQVMELKIPENCVLVYLIRAGSLFIPRGNTLIMGGDTVVALTIGSASRKLKKLFEI